MVVCDRPGAGTRLPEVTFLFPFLKGRPDPFAVRQGIFRAGTAAAPGRDRLTSIKRAAAAPDHHAGMVVVSALRVEDVILPPLGLPGTLRLPMGAKALVVFAHGSGSSRFSPRNIAVAEAFARAGIATLLFDLLTPQEEEDRANVFDIPLLAGRVVDAVRWLESDGATRGLPIGLFGASTGAAAALSAAATLGARVRAVVSRGGRPDLAGEALTQVRAPTLLIVGGADDVVLALNRRALARLTCPKALEIVPGATHLFPEKGALEAVIGHALRWFQQHAVEEQS
ncbi:MAG: dienelactone hydrolase family protein [Proteobacteria bacterium]|nr:dienelactone hydrolase family protein [Pseudomonadota bacterium]